MFSEFEARLNMSDILMNSAQGSGGGGEVLGLFRMGDGILSANRAEILRGGGSGL